MVELKDERRQLAFARSCEEALKMLRMLMGCYRVPGQVDSLWMSDPKEPRTDCILHLKGSDLDTEKTACYTEDGRALDNVEDFVRRLYVPPPL